MTGVVSFVVAIVVYVVLSLAICGHVLKPIMLLGPWSERLGLPFWQVIVLSAGYVSFQAILRSDRLHMPRWSKFPAFVAASMILSVLAIGLFAEIVRRERFWSFGAESQFQSSFLRSLHEAPEDFQFFLHGAALKDCVPYAWSYRELNFYRLVPNVAANVLPQEWLKRCLIEREQ